MKTISKIVLLLIGCVAGDKASAQEFLQNQESRWQSCSGAETVDSKTCDSVLEKAYRVPPSTLFDDKMREAREHCVILHGLERPMTEQEKQICDKVFLILYSKLKEQYFYVRSGSDTN